VFAGKHGPLIFGEPEEWIGLLVQANTLTAQNQFSAAAEMRNRALEAAPASAGIINEQPFEWIADADSRLGPMLELILDGKYYWAPFFRIKTIRIEPPTDLRNFVWSVAHFTWTNGGEASGFIPTRYPGSEAASDGAIQLARKTDWLDKGNEIFLGLGQRMFATNAGEYPLFETRAIEQTVS
jgi:type VI secretion system protein ImpE